MTYLYSVSRPGIHVARCIELDTVGDPGVDVCEHSAVLECVRFRVDVELVSRSQLGQHAPQLPRSCAFALHGGRFCLVVAEEPGVQTGVSAAYARVSV